MTYNIGDLVRVNTPKYSGLAIVTDTFLMPNANPVNNDFKNHDAEAYDILCEDLRTLRVMENPQAIRAA